MFAILVIIYCHTLLQVFFSFNASLMKRSLSISVTLDNDQEAVEHKTCLSTSCFWKKLPFEAATTTPWETCVHCTDLNGDYPRSTSILSVYWQCLACETFSRSLSFELFQNRIGIKHSQASFRVRSKNTTCYWWRFKVGNCNVPTGNWKITP